MEMGNAEVGSSVLDLHIADACELPRGAVQGGQPSESQVQGRGPGLDGPGVGARGIACRLFACFCFSGSETLTRFSEGSVIL